MTAPGIPNELVLSTSCFGSRLQSIEDQAFAAVAMGFRKLELGLSESPVDLEGFEETQRETGIVVTSVVSGCLKSRAPRMASTMLGHPDPDLREQALNSVRRHIRLAQAHGAPIVVLRGCSTVGHQRRQEALGLQARRIRNGLDEDLREEIISFAQTVQTEAQPQIVHLCRSLHVLMHEYPETRIALEPGEVLDDVLGFEAMGWVLSDLDRPTLGYWHDVGRLDQRERAGLPSQARWLDMFATRMFGVHLQDACDDESEMPPGSGEVDFRMIAEYVPKGVPRVIEISPSHGRAEILQSVRFLIDHGLG